MSTLFNLILERSNDKLYLNNIKFLDEIDDLELDPSEFYISASANLILFGYHKQNIDIDICITPEAFERIKDKLISIPDDELHVNHYTTKKGHLDIAIDSEDDPLGFTNQKNGTFVVDNKYRFLNKTGLQKFYKNLYKKFHNPKHYEKLQWIKQNI